MNVVVKISLVEIISHSDLQLNFWSQHFNVSA